MRFASAGAAFADYCTFGLLRQTGAVTMNIAVRMRMAMTLQMMLKLAQQINGDDDDEVR